MIAALNMAGATGPTTLAGGLAQQNAEIFAGINLAQLVKWGVPVIYGSSSTIMDMRTCALAIGTPKLSIIAAASTQLARYYGLPGRCGEALTDTNNPDLQAGFEPIFCLLTAANNGADFVLHTAGVLSSYLAYSHENFVIVDEMCGMVRRYYQGIAVDPDSPANDVINNGGAGGNLVQEEQTVTGCRQAFGQPALSDRNGLETWLANVQPDMIQRADQRWQDLLTEHEDPPVDATTKRQFQAYLAEREC